MTTGAEYRTYLFDCGGLDFDDKDWNKLDARFYINKRQPSKEEVLDLALRYAKEIGAI